MSANVQLTPENHETLAAFRVRFSEFQEHVGKIMRAIAREEEQSTEPFSFVLLYMEKLGILETVERWKIIRELARPLAMKAASTLTQPNPTAPRASSWTAVA